MSHSSPTRFVSDIHIDIETAEETKKEMNSPEEKLNRALPRLASRKTAAAAAQIPQTPTESITDDFKSIKERRKSRSASVCIKPSEGLSPEIEELRTKDIVPDANSAAEKALAAAAEAATHSVRDSTKYDKESFDTKTTRPKQKVEGREIQQDHAQYALTYGMMLGIRVTTSRRDNALDKYAARSEGRSSSIGSFIDERELTPRDFLQAFELHFPPHGASGPICQTPPHKLNFTFKFKDYMPNVFRAIRSLSGIDEADYLMSLAGDFNYIEFIANSKSGQFFFYSHDGKYMIKTQSKEESLLLRQILPKYVEHLNTNPDSLLVRFYGMHRVKMKSLRSKIHFVIMSSVFDTEKNIHVKYDLKGSTIGRLTDEKACAAGAVQKDLNLVNSGHKIRLGRENVLAFKDTLVADAFFLRDLNIMDYSLLIGIHDGKSSSPGRRRSSVILSKKGAQTSAGGAMSEVAASVREGGGSNSMSIFQSYYGGIRSTREANEIYFIGIIDILQLYNTGKKMETFFKGLTVDKSQLSSVNPTLYADRMIEFIMRHTDYDEVCGEMSDYDDDEYSTNNDDDNNSEAQSSSYNSPHASPHVPRFNLPDHHHETDSNADTVDTNRKTTPNVSPEKAKHRRDIV